MKTHVENDLEAFSKMAEAKRKVLTAQTKVDEAGKQARIAEESLSELESNEKLWQTQVEQLSDTDSRMIILHGKQYKKQDSITAPERIERKVIPHDARLTWVPWEINHITSL